MSEEVTESKKMVCYLDAETGELTYTRQEYKSKETREAEKYESNEKSLMKVNKQRGLINFNDIQDRDYNISYTKRSLPFGENYTFRGYTERLQERLCWYTNAIAHEKEPKAITKVMSKKDIIDFLNISEAQFYKYLKEAKSKGVLCEIKYDVNDITRTAILMNPAYTHRGNLISWELYQAFQTDATFISVLKESHILQFERASREVSYLK